MCIRSGGTFITFIADLELGEHVCKNRVAGNYGFVGEKKAQQIFSIVACDFSALLMLYML